MSFSDDLRAFQAQVEARNTTIFANVVSSARASITDGSPLTGAPGQPVDTGALKASFIVTRESPTTALISTHLPYAEGIEDGVSSHGTPIHFKSQVGGAHSIAKTIANIGRIVEDETKKAGGS